MVEIIDESLAILLARSIVVLDVNDNEIYTQVIPEITQEPDYEKAIKALKGWG